jgi:hypothetical protein
LARRLGSTGLDQVYSEDTDEDEKLLLDFIIGGITEDCIQILKSQ